MDARSPLSPKRTNLPHHSDTKGKLLARTSGRPANSASGTTLEHPIGPSPRIRRHATVSWLANFDSKQAGAQMEAVLGQHDENATAARNDRSLRSGKADGCSREGKRTAARGRMESEGQGTPACTTFDDTGARAGRSSGSSKPKVSLAGEPAEESRHKTELIHISDQEEGDSLELSVNDTPRGALTEEPDTEVLSVANDAVEAEATEADVDWGDLPSEQEIETYANYLGMRPKEDAELLWIAEQAMLCPLPDGWQEGVDADGRTYFYELETMTSCRAHPCDGNYMFLYKGLRRAVRESAVTFEAVIIMADRLGIDVATEPHLLWVARHALLSPLLPGWEEREDDEGTYYYDRRKDNSATEHPIDVLFVRMIATERKKRKDAQIKDPYALTLRNRKACVMELLDEDGDLYTFDWSLAEKDEPPADYSDTNSDVRPTISVLRTVASFLWKAPSAVVGAFSRSVSGLVEGQLLQVG